MRNRKAVAIIFVLTALLTGLCANAFAQREASETAEQAANRALRAHGGKWSDGSIRDWLGRGQIQITGNDSGSMNFTLAVKGRNMVQRVIEMPGGIALRHGSNGSRSWQSSGLYSGNAAGRAAQFIDSQTIRSIAGLFYNVSNGKPFRDLGSEKRDFIPQSSSSHAIESQDERGKATRYYVDNTNSLISRLEFDTGETFTLGFGEKTYPMTIALVFSDYRSVDGVMTPFKIEVYQGLVKVEEMTFTSIQYNTGMADSVFAP
jgi:hypothetical protein